MGLLGKKYSMREATKTPTQHLATQRHGEAEARSPSEEEQLALMRRGMEAAEMLIQQLVAERDESRSQLSESEAKAHSLEGQLETVAHQLKAEQDESRTQLSGFESHLQNLEELLVLAQRQFQDQRAAVTRMIQQRAVSKD